MPEGRQKISLISGELETYLKWRNPPTPGPHDRIEAWGESPKRMQEKKKTMNWFERKADNDRGLPIQPRKYIGPKRDKGTWDGSKRQVNVFLRF